MGHKSSTRIFKPISRPHDIRPAVTIHIRHIHSLMARPALICENHLMTPFFDLAGPRRNLRQEQFFRSLTPPRQFHAAVIIKIRKTAVVLIPRIVARLDQPSTPPRLRSVVRVGVFPPPHLILARITAENDIQITVAVDIKRISARFNMQGLTFDDETAPFAGLLISKPDDGRRAGAFGEHDVGNTILVDVENLAGGLLIAAVGATRPVCGPDTSVQFTCPQRRQQSCNLREPPATPSTWRSSYILHLQCGDYLIVKPFEKSATDTLNSPGSIVGLLSRPTKE